MDDDPASDMPAIHGVPTDPVQPGQPISQGGATAGFVTFSRSTVQSPFPPPDWLIGYNRAEPGSAATIIQMAVAEQRFQHDLKREEVAYARRALELDARASREGRITGVVSVIAVSIIGGILASHGLGHDAVALMGGTVVALAGVFVYEARKQAKGKATADTSDGTEHED